MLRYGKLSKGLRENILSVIGGGSTNEQLNDLLAVSHTLAHAFLSSKTTTKSLIAEYGVSTSDLAYDCIAELFQKDTDGNYVQLISYFKGLALTSSKEEEILAHLRRLVFSKVNQGVYRLCGDADPALAKILRNIKIAITTLKNFTETERFGEPCIAPAICNMQEELPAIDSDWIEKQFIPLTSGSEHIPELLAKLSLFLREQDERCKIVPFIMVGILFRTIYTCRQEFPAQAVTIDSDMIENDTRKIIDEACRTVRNRNTKKYVDNGKVTEEMFGKYFTVLEEQLCRKFIYNDGEDFLIYENLKNLSADLTKEEYKKHHRNKIEYLLKQVTKEAVKKLKQN